MDSRSGRIFSQIDVDGSGSVTKSEVIQMMVLGGAASESQAYSEANRLFDQGLITGKTMTERQFTQLFQAELLRAGEQSALETLRWFEKLAAAALAASSSFAGKSTGRGDQRPEWFQEPVPPRNGSQATKQSPTPRTTRDAGSRRVRIDESKDDSSSSSSYGGSHSHRGNSNSPGSSRGRSQEADEHAGSRSMGNYSHQYHGVLAPEPSAARPNTAVRNIAARAAERRARQQKDAADSTSPSPGSEGSPGAGRGAGRGGGEGGGGSRRRAGNNAETLSTAPAAVPSPSSSSNPSDDPTPRRRRPGREHLSPPKRATTATDTIPASSPADSLSPPPRDWAAETAFAVTSPTHAAGLTGQTTRPSPRNTGGNYLRSQSSGSSNTNIASNSSSSGSSNATSDNRRGINDNNQSRAASGPRSTRRSRKRGHTAGAASTSASNGPFVYERAGKDNRRVFGIAGCDARMIAAFRRLDQGSTGLVSITTDSSTPGRVGLMDLMAEAHEWATYSALDGDDDKTGKHAQEVFDAALASGQTEGGSAALSGEDFAHLFRHEKECRGEASAISLLQWFEMIASRLPEPEGYAAEQEQARALGAALQERANQAAQLQAAAEARSLNEIRAVTEARLRGVNAPLQWAETTTSYTGNGTFLGTDPAALTLPAAHTPAKVAPTTTTTTTTTAAFTSTTTPASASTSQNLPSSLALSATGDGVAERAAMRRQAHVTAVRQRGEALYDRLAKLKLGGRLFDHTKVGVITVGDLAFLIATAQPAVSSKSEGALQLPPPAKDAATAAIDLVQGLAAPSGGSDEGGGGLDRRGFGDMFEREFLRAGAQASAENARWLEALTTGAEEAPEAAAAAAAAGATDAQGDSSSSLGADAANLAAYLLAVAEEEARTAAADAPPAPAAASRDVAAASASVSTTATKAQLQNGASSHSPSSSSGRVSDGVIDHFPAGPSGGGGGDGAATAAAAAIEAATPLVLEDEDSGVSSNDSLFAVNVGGVDDEGFGRWADDEVAVEAAQEVARRSSKPRPGSVPRLSGTPQGQGDMTGNGFSSAPTDSKPSLSSSSSVLPSQLPTSSSSSSSSSSRPVVENLPKGEAPVEASVPHMPTRLPTLRAVTAESSSTRDTKTDDSNPLMNSDIAAVDENRPADGSSAVPLQNPSPEPDATIAAHHHNAADPQTAASAGNVNGLLAAANAHQGHLLQPPPGSNTSRSRTSGGDSTRRSAEDSGLGPSPARDRAKKAAKAAAAARAHYLRTAVDPVFVPLLDAVVFHKPRDVAAFVAERTLRQILTRGAESDRASSSNGQEQNSSRSSVAEQERTAVRAMLRRLLAEDEAAQAVAHTLQQVKQPTLI